MSNRSRSNRPATDRFASPTTVKLLETLEARQLLAGVPNLGFSYPDFADATGFSAQGAAAVAGDALRLTPAQAGQRGSAFYGEALALDPSVSFSTSFSFQTNSSQWGGEGIVFLIQNEAPDYLGPYAGNTLGYQGATKSVAIEFDPRANNNDAVDHEVSIVTGGNLSNVVAAAPAGLVLNSGTTRHAWIDYDGPSNTLSVYLSATDTKPAAATVEATVDIPAILGDQAYVGFTGTTSGFRNTQDILQWTFGDDNTVRPGAISVAPGSAVVDEDAGSVTLTLVRSGGSDGVASVSYATADGTALAGQDYTGRSGDIAFADGQTSRTVTVPITDDSQEELNESFTFNILAVTGAAVGTTTTATVVIRDNDAPPSAGLSFSYPGFNTPADLTLNADTTLAGDALRLTQNNPGQKGTAFHDTPLALTGSNGFETAFTLQWTGSTQWGGEGINFLMQTDGPDYSPPWAGNTMGYRGLLNSLGIEFDPISNRPGDQAGNEVTVVLNGDLDNPVARATTALDLNDGSERYAWVTYDGPSQSLAVYLSDQPARPATPLIETTVDLPTLFAGPAYAGFVATTSGYRNAQDVLAWSFTEDTGTAARPGAFLVDPDSVTVNEDAGTVSVQVLRTNGADGEVTVRASTANGSAAAGLDYTAVSQILTFADGQTSATLTVDILEDTLDESDETFEIALSSPTGGATVVSPDRSTVTIVDNDESPGALRLAATSYDVDETAGVVTVTVERVNGTNGPVSVFYTTADESATAGEDYTLTAGELLFADGQTAATIDVPILNDGASEGDETFAVSLDAVTGGATLLAPRTTRVTVLDDEQPVAGNGIGLKGEYFDNIDFTGLTFTRTDTGIDFNYAAGSPDARIADDSFSVRWSGQLEPVFTETYTLIATSDDGVRVTIDGTVVVDDFSDHGPRESTGTVALTAGQPVDILVEYYENAGTAEVKLEWLSASTAREVIPTTALYSEALPDPVDGTFAVNDVVTDLAQPTALEFDHLGRMWIAQKNGVVKLANNGTAFSTPFVDISARVNDRSDRGLLGLALHPDFPAQPYVYLMYTHDPDEVYNNVGDTFAGPDGAGARASRIERFTADAATNYTTAVAGSGVVILGTNSTAENIGALGSQQSSSNPYGGYANGATVWSPTVEYVQDSLPIDSLSHTIGSIDFAPDGSLFVTSGDGSSYGSVDTNTYRVQDIDSLNGKVLRIDPLTGEGLSDNPFYTGDGDDNASKVYAYGFRNPFRMSVHPTTGQPFLGDVGWYTWEEINAVEPGENYGWPHYEGGGGGTPLRAPGYQNTSISQGFYGSAADDTEAPLFARSHADGGVAIVGGDFYTGDKYPAQFNDAFFFADYGVRRVEALLLGDDGSLIEQQFVTGEVGGIVEMTMGPDGYMYLIDLGGRGAGSTDGSIKRLDFTPDSAGTIDLYLVAGQSNSFGNNSPYGALKNDLFSNGKYPDLASQLTPYAFSTPDVKWGFDFPTRTLGAFPSSTGAGTIDRLNIPDPDVTPGLVDLGLIGGTGGVVVTGPNGNATSPVIGPELSLGRTLLAQGADADALPAIATFGVGGRSLWANPVEQDFNPNSGELFDDMTEFFDELIAGLEAANYTVNVQGLVWVQGERDSKTAPLTGGGAAINYGDYNNDGNVNDALDAEDAYFDNLNLLIGELRARYGSGLEVILPAPKVDSTKTLTFYGSEYLNTPAITNAQQRVAASDSLVWALDTSSDFTFAQADDGLHYDALGQINLGISYANLLNGGSTPLISL